MFSISNVLALQAIFWGCTALYFSSDHQRTFAQSMPKALGNTLFVATIVLAAFLLGMQYNAWAMIFSTITMIIFNLALVTFTGAHENRPLRLLAYGTAVNAVLALIGGVYVA